MEKRKSSHRRMDHGRPNRLLRRKGPKPKSIAKSIERRVAGQSPSTQPVLRPNWNESARKLTLGEALVHRFNRPAPIAEKILIAFQEEGWPERIDDPLPPLRSGSEAERLRKEIYALNRRLQNPIIKFQMDGTGEGIRWEPIVR